MQRTCPCCGCAETLEQIKQEIRDMLEEGRTRADARRRANERPGDLVAGDGTLNIGVSGARGVVTEINGRGLEFDVSANGHLLQDHQYPMTEADVEISNRSTCVKCGTWWRPRATEAAEALREELLRVTNEVYTPIERMAKLAPPDGD